MVILKKNKRDSRVFVARFQDTLLLRLDSIFEASKDKLHKGRTGTLHVQMVSVTVLIKVFLSKFESVYERRYNERKIGCSSSDWSLIVLLLYKYSVQQEIIIRIWERGALWSLIEPLYRKQIMWFPFTYISTELLETQIGVVVVMVKREKRE